MNRRQFLSQSTCAALSSSAIFNTLFHLSAVGRAWAASGDPISDYKALVCVFLKGGNDSNNLLIPTAGSNLATYHQWRGALAVAPGTELALDAPLTAQPFGNVYGFHPRFGDVTGLPDSGLRKLWNDQKLAIAANVGSLLYPTTKAQYQAGSVPLPPQLFSHSDQQVQWQSSIPDQPFQTGWGGRMADLMAAANSALGAQISISMTLAGANSYQVGVATSAYAVGVNGSIPFTGYGDNYVNAQNPNTNAGRRLTAFRNITALNHSHLLKDGYAGVMNRAYDADRLLSTALAGFPTTAAPFTYFGTGTLSSQLRMIARLIAAKDQLCQKRQIFFCELDGFDTHDTQLGDHDPLLIELNEGLYQFQRAIEFLNLGNQVTTFTASDFSRTLTPNSGDATVVGSDHAWGGHQLIMGGAVRGGDIYGAIPVLAVNSPDDVDNSTGRGRWIPTLSVDEYAATLARWFGVTGDALNTVFPNLARFSHPDLGFMQPAA